MDSSTPSKLRNMRWFEMHLWPIMEERKLRENICFWGFSFFTVLFIITLQPTFSRYCHFTKENFDRLVALWIAEQSYGNILLSEVFHTSRRDIRLLFGCAKVNNPEQVFLRCEKKSRNFAQHATCYHPVICNCWAGVPRFEISFLKKRDKVIENVFHVYSC